MSLPSTRILCVLVLYGRGLDRVEGWPELRQALDDGPGHGLAHLLVYDNSPNSAVEPGQVGANVTLHHDPTNGGTAAAYAKAAQLAGDLGCDWVLLMDQDTRLRADDLANMAQAARHGQGAAALVPRIRHGDQPISPARMMPNATVIPQDTAEPPSEGFVTAISSGAMIATAALRAALPFPPGLWLDYVDHWIFLSIHRNGGRVSMTDVTLDHDLSILTPATLSLRRVESILNGEAILADELGGRARSMLRLRRLRRAVRLWRSNPAAARLVLSHALRGRAPKAGPQ